MLINTVFFGELNFEEEELLVFNQGIPGFEDFKHFLKVQPDPEVPFLYLQSTDEGSLSFLLTDPFLFFQDYDFQLSTEQQLELGIHDDSSIEVLVVVTVNEDFTEATANLLAPIIINNSNQTAKQIILHDSDYKTKHQLPLSETSQEATKGSV